MHFNLVIYDNLVTTTHMLLRDLKKLKVLCQKSTQQF